VAILALSNEGLSSKLDAYREEMANAVEQADMEVINGSDG